MTLLDNIVKEKIKVFVSSRSGISKYDEVRKKLKERIEQTNLAEVYLFEDGLASTQTAEQEYLYAIDDSNICIFLIDNADNVTPAVVKEIERAKALSKQSLFIFCDENKKEITQVQKELTGAKGARYYVTNSFNEFVDKGYQSLINDITTIYKNYCSRRLIDHEFNESNETQMETDSTWSYVPNRDLLNGMDKTKGFITSTIYDMKRKIEKTSDLDNYCTDFLQVLFGKRNIREFNTSLLLENLKKEQSENLYKVVEIRWKAIQNYWQENLEECLNLLRNALTIAREEGLSDWIIQDILIDLRNLANKCEEERNWCRTQNNPQEELSNIGVPLHYPLLDRYTSILNEKMDKQRVKQKVASPNSVSIGNNSINAFADYITNIYVISVFNGSLTHILMTIDRVKNVAFHLSELYSDWQFRVLLLKMSICMGNRKETERYIKAFNSVFGKMNAADALEIYHFTLSKPIKHKRYIAMLEAFNHLGYYFSDQDYQIVQKDVLDLIENWISDSNRVVVIGSRIFKALKNNRLRINNNKIIQLCLDILSEKMYRFYDDVFDLLSFINFDEINTDLLKEIIEEVNKIVLNEKENSKYHKLVQTLINIRKSNKKLASALHQNVLSFLTEKDIKIYTLEVTKDSEEYNKYYLFSFIKEIEKRNKTQGENGTYTEYENDPYQTIVNIIAHNHLDLIEEEVKRIFEATINTLTNSRQLISDKVSAMRLVIFMKKYCDHHKITCYEFYEKLDEAKEYVVNGHDSILAKHSTETLEFDYTMLEVAYNVVGYGEIFKVLGNSSRSDEFERIQALKAIINLLYDDYSTNLDSNIIYSLLQFTLSMSHVENHDVRFYSVKALLLMVTKNTEKTVLTRLSQVMDYDSAYIKIQIINDFDRLMYINSEIVYLMMQKASVDNHYIVRERGLKYLEKHDGFDDVVLLDSGGR